MPTSRQLLSAGAALLLVAAALGLTIVFGFVGLGLIAILVLLVCVWLELEQDGAVGSEFTPELYARQIESRAAAPLGERLDHEQERAALLRRLRPIRLAAGFLLAVAVAGFLLLQA